MTYTTSITPGRYSAEAVTSNLSVYTATVAVTRPSNTTAYAAGDVIGAANTTTAANAGNAILTFPNVGGGGGAIRIDSVDLFINNTTVPSGMDAFRLHLYSIPPAAILDNAAFDLTSTDVPRYLGFVTLALPVDIGSTLYSSTVSVNKVVRMLPYSETLFGVLETRGGYTPASGTLYTVKLNTTDVDEATTGSENLLWAYAGGAVPTLDLEFARTKTLNNQVTSTPPVTFTRASTATFVGSDRTIQTAAVDAPRFDHNPTTGESLGLLVEEARTNLALQSEDFSTTWSLTGATVTTNNATGLAGTTTADKLIESAGGTNHLVGQAVTIANATVYTLSVFAKAAERSRVAVYFGGSGGASQGIIVNLSTGAFAANIVAAPTSYSIVPFPNGWYRISITATSVGTAANYSIYICDDTNSFSYSGDGASGLLLWGAQLEAGAFPTSYIPTTTATATRAADIARITGTDFSQFYNQSEGTLHTDAYVPNVVPSGSFPHVASLTDGTFNNCIINNFVTSTLAGFQVRAGSTTFQVEYYPPTSSLNRKLSSGYKLNDFASSVNGGTLSTDTAGTLPTTLNVLQLGNFLSANFLNGTIRRLTYWPTRLANTTLQQISTP
jgi:hypothetical protein